MKIGICKECFADVPLTKEYEVAEGIYECKNCDYPNGIRNGDFWEIYESNTITQEGQS